METSDSWNDLWFGVFLAGCVCLCIMGGIKVQLCPPRIKILWLIERKIFFCLCLGWKWGNQGASVWIHAQWVSGRHPGRSGRAQAGSGRIVSWATSSCSRLKSFSVCVLFLGRRAGAGGQAGPVVWVHRLLATVFLDLVMGWQTEASELHQVEKYSPSCSS